MTARRGQCAYWTHLAIVLLVEQGVCLLRHRRAGDHHLQHLPILAAFLPKVFDNLQETTNQIEKSVCEAARLHPQRLASYQPTVAVTSMPHGGVLPTIVSENSCLTLLTPDWGSQLLSSTIMVATSATYPQTLNKVLF